MTLRSLLAVPALACAVAACTPVLDWREVRPQGADLVALFPCKPAGHARQVVLAGTSVEMTLYACFAGGATYAVGFADPGRPQSVEPALAELAAAAARNIGAPLPTDALAARVPGMTPNPKARRLSLTGQLADGKPVQAQVAVFARGTRVYQATVVGTSPGGEALESFFGALRLPS